MESYIITNCTTPLRIIPWDDTERSCAICYNVALHYAKGDYISHLAYDDKISLDYAEKIISLFLENKKCLTAAPMPYSINSLEN